jgi:4-alpha-glucanotransferase
MKLNLSIEYRTNWGEEIVLCLGGKRYPLSYVAEGIWKGEIARFTPGKASEYTYEVVRDGVTIRTEWKKHLLVLPEGTKAKVVNIYDKWNDRPLDAPFYSSAFTDAIFGRKASKTVTPEGANVVIQVSAPSLRPDEVLAIAGSGTDLKEWTKVIPFDESRFPVWSLSLKVTEPFAYKILVADRKTLVPVAWEEGENRWFLNVPQNDEVTVEADAQVRFSGRDWKGAGTAIPVFSLRTEDDFGVGEF